MIRVENKENSITSYLKRKPTTKFNPESYFQKRQWELFDFNFGKPLGKGNFADVYIAKEKLTNYLVAIKLADKYELTQFENEQFKKEFEIHSQLKHPNVSRMFGRSSEEEERVFLIMEYARNGDLYRELQRVNQFSESKVAKYIAQIAEGLKYCHLMGIIHRDIKPENILIGHEDVMKVTDFGLSVYSSSSKRTSACGTRDYMCPEMAEGKPYDKQIDLWCLGVLCYELLVGEPPFVSDSAEASCKRIKAVDIRFPSFVSDGARDLISNLLKKNPSNRLSLDGVLSHPWINGERMKSGLFVRLFRKIKSILFTCIAP